LIYPTRPRGMSRVTATFTHTAATITIPTTAPAIRTSLMLNVAGGAGLIAEELCPRAWPTARRSSQPECKTAKVPRGDL
jgi:hypothetical protein